VVDTVLRWLLRRSARRGIPTAFCSVALAAAIRFALHGFALGAAFTPFHPAVIVTAFVGGWPSACLAAVLSILVAVFFWVPPGFSVQPGYGGIILIIMFWVGAAIEIALVEMAGIAAHRLRTRQRVMEGLLERNEALLDVRAVMFRELRHRVANMMQFVASMMILQGRRLRNDQEGKLALQEGARRLVMMAQIHRRLYDPDAVRRGFGPMARDILGGLLQAAGCGHIRLDIEADERDLPLDTTSVLVMIAAEAATNAIKHVFTVGAGSALTVRLVPQEGDRMELVIRDDGPDQPIGPEAGKEHNLGQSIMQSLAHQIGGRMRAERKGGTAITVAFPLSGHEFPEN
jgi:two-component sensor histidine kinase